MAPGLTCPDSSNKEEGHQDSAGVRFYSWKVLLLRARRMFLWRVVLPFSLPAKFADSVDLKDGLLNYRVCTVKFLVVESYFS